jgi:hypothetical protein
MMDISHNEAEEALETIETMMKKTRHSIASSGAHISLIITGTVWLIGFMATQFLAGEIVVYIWIGLSILGASLATIMSIRVSKRVRSETAAETAKRIGFIWLLLAVYCAAAIALTWPLDGKQLTALIVLFVMIGWLAMGLTFSIYNIWIWLFLLTDIFYLWIAILGGGGMITLGLYIRYRW